MILNGLIALILRYFTELGSFGADYDKMVKDRPLVCAMFDRSVAQRL